MFWKNFEELCRQFGVSPSRVCREIGMSENTASAWKTRGNMPRTEIIHKLAEYFNVSESYFYTEQKAEQNTEMSRQRKTALDLIDQVPEEKLQRVIDFVSGLLS